MAGNRHNSSSRSTIDRPQSPYPHFRLTATLACLAFGCTLAGWWWLSKSPNRGEIAVERDAAKEAPQPNAGNDFDSDRAIATLVAAGWEKPAARTVVTLNSPYLSILARSSTDESDAKIRHLARLGDPRHAYVRKRLETMPEIAGLLANTLDRDANGPAGVVTAIGNDTHSQAIASLFAFSATADEAVPLAEVIRRDRDLAVRLAESGDASLLSWLAPKDFGEPRITEVYQAWARRVIADAVAQNRPEALDEAFQILAMHGECVLGVLRADAGFRDALVGSVYPVFRTVFQAQADDGFSREAYLLCPQIWEFIHRYPRNAQNLLAKVGPLAIDTIMDPRLANCQEGLIDVLSFADQSVVDGLLDDRVRGHIRFPAFLARDLPASARVAALQRLSSEPENAGRNLQQWEGMTTAGVVADVGPEASGPVTWLPGYSAAVLVTKASQGRPVTGTEACFAALDVVEVVFMARGGGAALKAIGAAAQKSAAKRVGVAAAKGIGRESAEATTKQATRALAPWTFKAARQAARQGLASLQKALVLDVSSVVRGLYKRSGLNAKTFKVIDGLDARIFMRKDRRVVLDFTGDNPLGRFLSETATNAGIEEGLGNETVVAAARTAVMEGPAAIEAARRNISAWWFAVGDGTLDKLVPKVVATAIP